MMTSTASVQVNLDAGPRGRLGRAGSAGSRARADDDRDRGQLAAAPRPLHRVACSSGSGYGVSSTRRAAGRSSVPAVTTRPATGRAMRCSAPVMLVHTPGRRCRSPQWVPFADWADGRVLLGDRRPTVADLDYHLTTLFPPVRPRAVPGDPLPRQRAGRAVAGGGVHAGHPARRPGRRRTSPPRRPSRWPPRGIAPRGSAWATGGCTPPPPAVCRRRPNGPRPDSQESMQRLLARSVEQGRCPADDFADRAVKYGIAGAVTQLAQGRGAVTSREVLAAELSRARDRTLRLVDFDDAELRRQYDPLMSPLVWDLAHIGQQEELWLLRGGDPRPARACCPATSKASTTRSSTPAPAGSTCRCCPRPRRGRTAATVRRPGARRARRAARRATPSGVHTSGWWSATRTSTTRRCCRR